MSKGQCCAPKTHNLAILLELFQRVITVSLETMKIVDALPELDIEVAGKNVIEGKEK